MSAQAFGKDRMSDSEPRTLSKLFEERPHGWGLRGDPRLWEEMRVGLSEAEWPGTEEELERILNEAFRELTGSDSETEPDRVYLEKYDKGGMSGGVVSKRFWREVAFPLLLERYREETGGG